MCWTKNDKKISPFLNITIFNYIIVCGSYTINCKSFHFNYTNSYIIIKRIISMSLVHYGHNIVLKEIK